MSIRWGEKNLTFQWSYISNSSSSNTSIKCFANNWQAKVTNQAFISHCKPVKANIYFSIVCVCTACRYYADDDDI